MPASYLFAWKPDNWPYENLRRMVDLFEAGKPTSEPWRCQSHRKIRVGDRAYVVKIGQEPRGIFAVGTIGALPKYNPKAKEGENPWQVRIDFNTIVDPTERLLVSERELLQLDAPAHRWHPQGSGVSLEDAAALQIDILIANQMQLAFPETAADENSPPPKDEHEARERTLRSIILRRGQQKFRNDLIKAYSGKCAVTGCEIVDLLEAAHIKPFSEGATNSVTNGLLLRADIHTLFDCNLLGIEPDTRRIVLNKKIRHSSYKKLHGKIASFPKDSRKTPSRDALFFHLKNCIR